MNRSRLWGAVGNLIVLFFLAVALTLPVAAQPADLEPTPPTEQQLHHLRHALVRLPEAAALACVLALRPHRRGTARRPPSVIQTQIVLGVLGAAIMLIVGSSVARAFGIVGAAGLVRYRAMIDDPEDAAVMLCTLAVGLAAGVGAWALAIFGTGFLLAVLWIIESFEPAARKTFMLKMTAKDPAAIRADLENVLRGAGLAFDLRELSEEELQYEVKMPHRGSTSGVSDRIMAAGLPQLSAVEWDEPKKTKQK